MASNYQHSSYRTLPPPRPFTAASPAPDAASSILIGTELSDNQDGGNNNTGSGGGCGAGGGGGGFDPAAFVAAHERTMAHGRAVLAARKAARRVDGDGEDGGACGSGRAGGDGGARRQRSRGQDGGAGEGEGRVERERALMLPPVWTPHRGWLCEALGYVGRRAARGGAGVEGETVSETTGGGMRNGSVVSLVLGREGSGRRGYLDGEILICEVGGAPGLWEAWERTMLRKGSVVIVVGRGWQAAEEVIPWPRGIGEGGYVVLDNFRVGEMWEEGRAGGRGGRREGGTVVRMVKLQKAELGDVSWWMRGKEGGERVLPLGERRFMGDEWQESKRARCNKCDGPMPKVYRECWICMNSSCGMFWREGLVRDKKDGFLQNIPIPGKLRWDRSFLMARTTFDPDMRASWELRPDLTKAFTRPWEIVEGPNVCVAGTIKVRSLWRGGACDGCRTIVPAVEWCVWKCSNPHCPGAWRLRVDIGPMPLRAAVPRMFESWSGHPLVEADWAEDLGGRVTRIYRPAYMVDSWNVDNGEWPIKLKIITPTADLNEKSGGADEIWANLLTETRLPFGSGAPNDPRAVKEPRLVLTRSNQYPKLDKYFHRSFGVDYGFNQGVEVDLSRTEALPMRKASQSVTQAREVLSDVSRDELDGFDIDEPNSLQVYGYMDGMSLGWHVGGEEDLGTTVATLSLGSDAELLIRRRTDSEAQGHPGFQQDDGWPVVTRVPLLHGSIVLIHGPFHELFETKIDCKGPLRFAVTTRHIRQSEKADLLQAMTAEKILQRFNGQWFINGDDDEDEEEALIRHTHGSWSSSRPTSRRPSSVRPPMYGMPTSHPYQPGPWQTMKPSLKRPRPRQRSPSPRPRQKRCKAPSEPDEEDPDGYKTAGWTPQQKEQIYEWKKKGHTYKEVAKMFEEKWPTGKVKHGQLRMVVHRVRKDRQKRAAILGEKFSDDEGMDQDDESSIAPSDSASATLGCAYVDPSKWTKAEIDLLVQCRNQDPPMAYRDISAKMLRELHRTRSDKACREQMTTLNRKKKGMARIRAPTSAPRPATTPLSAVSERGMPFDAASPLTRPPMNAAEEVVHMSGREHDSVPVQEQTRRKSSLRRAQPPTPPAALPLREGRGSRGSRSGRAGGPLDSAGSNRRGASSELTEGAVLSPVQEETPSSGRRYRTRSLALFEDDEEIT